MRRHRRLYNRLFRKTYRHRPNQRAQYLQARKKRRAKQVRRALQQGTFLPNLKSRTLGGD